MNEQAYFQQFTGQNIPPGTRFKTRHVGKLHHGGIAFDCISVQEAINKTMNDLQKWKDYWQTGDVLELIEIDPGPGWAWERERIIGQFRLVDRQTLEAMGS